MMNGAAGAARGGDGDDEDSARGRAKRQVTCGANHAAGHNEDGALAHDENLQNMTGTFNLMQFSDEMLMRIMTVHDVGHGSLAFVKALKQTNKHLRHAIRVEMYTNKVLSKHLHDVACQVPGTKIPCNAEHVAQISLLSEAQELINFFLSSIKIGPHNIAVGGAFRSAEDAVASFTWHNDGFYYLSVHIDVEHEQFLENLPLATSSTYDISGLPNVVRLFLELPERTHDVDEIDNLALGYSGFDQLLRVRPGHTLGQVYDAIAHAQGWTQSDYNATVIFMRTCNRNWTVAELMQRCEHAHHAAALVVSWPSPTTGASSGADNDEDEDEDEDDSAEDGAEDGAEDVEDDEDDENDEDDEDDEDAENDKDD